MKIYTNLSYKPENVVGGYTDKVLRVDLTSKNINIINLPPDFKNKYIGGRGYAIKLIWDETNKDTRFDSPDNLFVVAHGPLGNEPAFPGTGKFIVGTISPLTGTFVDSNVGGHFGPLLKLAGFDAIAVSGISEKDVIIEIDADAGTIKIIEAEKFGKSIDDGSFTYGNALLKSISKDEFDDNVALITTGKGAENANFGIVNSFYYDKRRKRIRSKQAGRGGTGTVMRYKGIKAVVIRSNLSKANGNNAVDTKGVKKSGSELRKVLRKFDPEQLHLSAWGTTVLSEYMDRFFIFPICNYQYGQSSESSKVFSDVFLDKYFSKKIPDGCYYGCNLACAKGAEDVLMTRGNNKGEKVPVDGPEYETVGAVVCMGIFDPHFIMEYNWYCDEYGLDTISTGVSIAFFMECFERGYLTQEDIGYNLKFGDKESALRLIEEISDGIGFGKIVGQGVAKGKCWVAEKYASKKGLNESETYEELNQFGMEVKGLEFSMYICKESLAQQGGYGFSLKGPQHDEAWLIFIDQVHQELPTFELKANALKWFPLIRTWFNATGLCKLPWIDVRHPEASKTDNPAKNYPSLEYYVQYLNATVGCKKTLDDIIHDSERLYVLQKLINLRQGKGTRKNDLIPMRAMGPVFYNEYEARKDYYDNWLKENYSNQEIPEDPAERLKLIKKLRAQNYQQLCDAVYKEKGFSNDGVPLPETIEKFGLMDDQARQLLQEYNQIN